MKEWFPKPKMITAVALITEGGLVVIAVLIGRWFGHNPLIGVGWTRDALGPNLLAVLVGAVASLPMLGGLFIIDRWTPSYLVPLKRSVEREVVPLFANSSVGEFAIISLAAGLGEELFFRGLLQAGLADYLPTPWSLPVSIFVVSAAFGMCHWLNREYAIVATAIGVYLGILVVLAGNLLAPITAHALYDFVALWYLVLGKRASPALE
jgi:membrane protease YdiL (CAAX protease family)